MLRPLLTVLLSVAAAAPAPAQSRPNVVVILADDLGYGDVAALNPGSRIPTPNLDLLAVEGITFTDAHAPAAVCTPTRYGLLTGRYCWRSALKSGVLNGYGAPLIEPSRATLGSLFREAGYRTGAVGKWHLGLGFARADADAEASIDWERPIEGGPTALGFDTFFGIPASLDFPPYVYVRDDRVTESPGRRQASMKFPAFVRSGERAPDFEPVDALDRLLRAALEFVQDAARRDAPFFLYFALTAPHKPVLPHPRFTETTSLGPYGDFVVQTDATVGTLLAALQRAGVANETVVVFTSDNGSFMHARNEGPDHVDDPKVQAYTKARHRANHGFRGTKADIWEAGHRVPFFVRWPGVVPAGSVDDTPVCHVDLMATFAELLGAQAPASAEDSFSLLGRWRDQPDPPTRPPVIHHSGNGMFAIRDGHWKLVLGNGSGGREAPRGKPFERPYPLFDLQTDPGETRDVAGEHGAVVQRLTATFEDLRAAGSGPMTGRGR
ncbi:MAG: arylsulfatase [Planctomycetota bacterium]